MMLNFLSRQVPLLAVLLSFVFLNPSFAQPPKVVDVVSGTTHSLALVDDGTVWSWGSNTFGELGIGIDILGSNIPVPVLDPNEPTMYLKDVTSIASSWSHNLALKNGGTVWSWGSNWYGQLGNGQSQSLERTPVQVTDVSDGTGFLTNVAAVAAGDLHSLALKNDGTVWAWGEGLSGQLGVAPPDSVQTSPTQVKDPNDITGNLTGIIAIAAGGSFNVALKSDGQVYAWGASSYGRLGRGDNGYLLADYEPHPVIDPPDPSGKLTDVIAIAAGWEHALALKQDSTVVAWGRNDLGQLGNGDNIEKNTPVLVSGLSNITSIAANNRHSAAIRNDATAWTWGANNFAQLGDGSQVHRNTPVQVSGLTDVIDVGPGADAGHAVKSDNTVWSWGENSTGQVGDETAQFRLTPVLTHLTLPEKGFLEVIGPYFVTPGEEIDLIVKFQNVTEITLNKTIVMLDIPEFLFYISSTKNGQFINENLNKEVFWRLGNVAPGEVIHLPVKLSVQWGISPHTKLTMRTEIGAENISSNLNIDDYLNNTPNSVISEAVLNKEEIDSLLSSNNEIKELLDYAKSRGYEFYNIVHQLELSNSSPMTIFVLLNTKGNGPAYLYQIDDSVFIETHEGSGYSLFDKNGGYTEDTNTWSFKSWGSWASSSNTQPLAKSVISDILQIPKDEFLSISECTVNCIKRRVPQWIDDAARQDYDSVRLAKVCHICWKSVFAHVASCEECSQSYITKKVKDSAIYQDDVKQCSSECITNSSSHKCTEDYLYCDLPWFETYVYQTGKDYIYRRKCQKDIGRPDYGRYVRTEVVINCASLQTCINGVCVDHEDGRFSANIGNLSVKTAIFSELEVVTAHDPNEKSVDPGGNVIPGQQLNYTIEYENEGQGNAYGVFLLDDLNENLNELSLIINNDGEYIDIARLLSWDIGEVQPNSGGKVTFSVTVKDDVPSGTEIINNAEVHFPSVPEITPTNAVVNIVKAIVADPKTVETLSAQDVAISLTGRDTDSNTLTYKISTNPLYGTITDTPPNITYTSMDEFVGVDEFYYVANNGTVDSDPARVMITVDPNPADSNPPTVTKTYPESGTVNVHVDATAVSTNPDIFRPVITATISEQINEDTLSTGTFIVEGVTGEVGYDEKTRTASFIPSIPLSNSTTYTARLGTGIQDKVGNAMAAEYSWQFTTESPINLAVALPGNANSLDFGDVKVNETAEEAIVSLSSTGVQDLTIQSLSLIGANLSEFTITQDNCAGVTLTQFENCTGRISFAPTAAGDKTAQLNITSNDNDEGVVFVNLSGAGVDTAIGDGDSDGGGSSGCFIATAAYGSYLDPHVQVLRDFRDDYLLTNEFGQTLVETYYTHSPPIAEYLQEHEILRTTTRWALTILVLIIEHPLLSLFFISFFITGLCYRKLSRFNVLSLVSR